MSTNSSAGKNLIAIVQAMLNEIEHVIDDVARDGIMDALLADDSTIAKLVRDCDEIYADYLDYREKNEVLWEAFKWCAQETGGYVLGMCIMDETDTACLYWPWHEGYDGMTIEEFKRARENPGLRGALVDQKEQLEEQIQIAQDSIDLLTKFRDAINDFEARGYRYPFDREGNPIPLTMYQKKQ